MSKQWLIKCIDVCRSFGKGKKKFLAVDHLNTTFYQGENVALLGSNGAGKTTLVEMIVGLNKPTTGKILFSFGKTKIDCSRNIGIQFQDSTYPPNISVKSVIDFVRRAYGSDITNEELSDMIDTFMIRDFYKRDTSGLSGGQTQRLNILLALIHRPKIVFLDELSTGLDITIRTQIKEFIKVYATKHSITIVLVSHDMNEVEYLTDRIVIMSKGKIIQDVNTHNIIKKFGSVEKYVTKFINH
ncbi:MAG: ABC transporter ATP-binding protein [Mycoplasmataceae bacterium]|jgi:ABC-2 type transport system ATP-binding protein|nr:ABC transporter ATP-binding protein [Mycoplasmataceae bacterium]